jgi:hypothetical protein
MYHTIGAFSGFSSFGVYRFPTYQKLIDFHDPTGVTGWLGLRVKRRSRGQKKERGQKRENDEEMLIQSKGQRSDVRPHHCQAI